jgi:hypothetical protein
MKKLSVLFILLAILISGCEKDEDTSPSIYDIGVASIAQEA